MVPPVTGQRRPTLRQVPLAADATPRMWWAIRKVFRGYDIAQVDALLGRAGQALATGSELQRAQARQALRSAELTRRAIGYAPRSVHGIFRQLSRELGADH